jgi:hypothetical protein
MSAWLIEAGNVAVKLGCILAVCRSAVKLVGEMAGLLDRLREKGRNRRPSRKLGRTHFLVARFHLKR